MTLECQRNRTRKSILLRLPIYGIQYPFSGTNSLGALTPVLNTHRYTPAPKFGEFAMREKGKFRRACSFQTAKRTDGRTDRQTGRQAHVMQCRFPHSSAVEPEWNGNKTRSLSTDRARASMAWRCGNLNWLPGPFYCFVVIYMFAKQILRYFSLSLSYQTTFIHRTSTACTVDPPAPHIVNS